MRVAVGDKGILSQDLPTLCCSLVIPAGTWIVLDRLHSPKRMWVSFGIDSSWITLPDGSGGQWIPVGACHDVMSKAPGVLEPPFRDAHKVKASKIWFEEVAYAVSER